MHTKSPNSQTMCLIVSFIFHATIFSLPFMLALTYYFMTFVGTLNV